jgi:hypothetical protein
MVDSLNPLGSTIFPCLSVTLVPFSLPFADPFSTWPSCSLSHQNKIMFHDPETDRFLSPSVHPLEHIYPVFLCQSSVLRPRKLFDETLLDPKHRIQCNVLTVMRVQRCGKSNTIRMLKYEVLFRKRQQSEQSSRTDRLSNRNSTPTGPSCGMG